MKLSDFLPSGQIVIDKQGNMTQTKIPSRVSVEISNLINNLRSGVDQKVKEVTNKFNPNAPIEGKPQLTSEKVKPNQVQPTVLPTAKPDPLKGYTRSQVPDEFRDLIISSAQKEGLNPALIAAMLFQESGIQPLGRDKDNVSNMESGVVSRDRGMAQISDYWNPSVTDEQAYDPNFAIPYMAKTIKENLDKTGKLSEAVAAYNVGVGRVGKHPSRPTGIGPKGQEYLSGIRQNLDDNLARELGLY